ncbi:MAG: glycosyltransferase [Xenococcaceae cyanobacterium MO_188.B32]|nr:glycosyltransferase [Xenococcaceae cyanobacterium MO_188.B32]
MNSQHLKFSIVIPTYNRPERLANCLNAIAQLDYLRDRFEVIVVDDGSRMPLNPITAKFEAHLSLHLIQQCNSGPASARNAGAATAFQLWSRGILLSSNPRKASPGRYQS